MDEDFEDPIVKLPIYFVRKRYEGYANDCQKAEDRIRDRLSSEFEVRESFDLSRETVKMVEKDVGEGVLAKAMITHVPFDKSAMSSSSASRREDFYGRAYRESRHILTLIKIANPTMPIIVYTGGDRVSEFQDVFLNEGLRDGAGPAKFVVFKSSPDEWRTDAEILRGLIRYV